MKLTYVPVQVQLTGPEGHWYYIYNRPDDEKRYTTRKMAIREGIKYYDHDDFVIAILDGDTLVGIAWQFEDREPEDFMDEAPGIAAEFGWKVRTPVGYKAPSPEFLAVEQLARQGHGAIQVALPEPGKLPIKVVIGGPIKYWWSLPDAEWGTGRHAEYLQWRDAVEAAFVQAGFLVYMPYKAWRGSWHEHAQQVNDAAIEIADIFVYLTPPGIPDEGTQEEVAYAQELAVPVFYLPPSTTGHIEKTIESIKKTQDGLYDD